MNNSTCIKLAPSILSADFGRLGEQIEEATLGGADYIHIDIMDGRFVPNLTMGPLIVKHIRTWTSLPLDIHMMTEHPENLIDDFVKYGSDIITVHAEASSHLHRIIHQIKNSGIRAGIALNPSTPIGVIEDLLPDLDQILIMTVNPGFGGQTFIPTMINKIKRTRTLIDNQDLNIELEVDGGINELTAQTVVKAGAQILVAGSAIYNSETKVAEAIARIRGSIGDI